jgi:hypothetical protein
LGATATGFAAGLAATGLWATVFTAGLAAAFGAVLGAAFKAVAFEPAAFAEVFAVLLGIALLLFFEDFVAEALVGAFLREVLARPLVAPRLTADAFFELLETLFLRVFCDTACARNRRAPVRVSREPLGPFKRHNRIRSIECAYNSTFSVKINGLCPIPWHRRPSGGQNTG